MSQLRKMLFVTAAIVLIVPSCFCQTPQPSEQISPGQIIASVTCQGDSTQSYALYLPSAYTPSRKWPIIYLFDPGARGELPVELYKDIAEKYGFILAGSNNSRNFMADTSRAMTAIWLDTHSRFTLDERRIYTSGFSGGARVAGQMALACTECQIAGVIAHGAGYPNRKPEGKDHLLYFLAVGDQDFNWPEVIGIRRAREEQGLSYRVRVFQGPHQWAPVDVMEQAVEWMMLKSMQAGIVTPDSTLIDRLFNLAKSEAEDATKNKDAISQFNAYRMLTSDFSGLKDVKEYANKLATLKASLDLKVALKREQQQIFDQGALEDEIAPKLNTYTEGKAADPISLSVQIVMAMKHLRDQAAHDKNDVQRNIAARAFNQLLIQEIETGQQEFESHHLEKAESCFQLMSVVSEQIWPELLLAETHAAMGNKKQALKDLKEAIRRGLNDPEAVEGDARLQGLVAEPDFQKMLRELKAK
jgi:dienelactone hydrolase